MDITTRFLNSQAESKQVHLRLAAAVNGVESGVSDLRILSRSSARSWCGSGCCRRRSNNNGIGRVHISGLLRLQSKGVIASVSTIVHRSHHQLTFTVDRDYVNEQGKRRCGHDEKRKRYLQNRNQSKLNIEI